MLEKVQKLVTEDVKRNDVNNERILRERYLHLTPRECQIMQYITTGKLNKQIANECSGKVEMSHLSKIEMSPW